MRMAQLRSSLMGKFITSRAFARIWLLLVMCSRPIPIPRFYFTVMRNMGWTNFSRRFAGCSPSLSGMIIRRKCLARVISLESSQCITITMAIPLLWVVKSKHFWSILSLRNNWTRKHWSLIWLSNIRLWMRLSLKEFTGFLKGTILPWRITS